MKYNVIFYVIMALVVFVMLFNQKRLYNPKTYYNHSTGERYRKFKVTFLKRAFARNMDNGKLLMEFKGEQLRSTVMLLVVGITCIYTCYLLYQYNFLGLLVDAIRKPILFMLAGIPIVLLAFFLWIFLINLRTKFAKILVYENCIEKKLLWGKATFFYHQLDSLILHHIYRLESHRYTSQYLVIPEYRLIKDGRVVLKLRADHYVDLYKMEKAFTTDNPNVVDVAWDFPEESSTI